MRRGTWLVCDSQNAVATLPHCGPLAIAATSRTRRLLPMPGGPTTPTTAPWPSIARSNKPSTADISHRRPTRFDSARPMSVMLVRPMPNSRWASHRFIGTLDLNQLRLAESRYTINESRGRCAQHHPAGRSDRLHPLSHPHLLADGGVTERARTDFTGDHLTRVQAHPQLEIDTVAILDLGGKPLRPPLECPRPPGRREQRGPPIATGAPNTAIMPSPVNWPPCRHTAAPPQPTRLTRSVMISRSRSGTDRRSDVHRVHHVGEQDGDLLVLSRSGWRVEQVHRTRYRTWSSAAVRCRTTHTAAPSRSVHRHHPRWGPRQYRFTAGQRCPSYRRAISDTKF